MMPKMSLFKGNGTIEIIADEILSENVFDKISAWVAK